MGMCICKKPIDTEREITKSLSLDFTLTTRYSQEEASQTVSANALIEKRLNSYEMSKYIFNLLNDIRLNPLSFINIAKKHGLEGMITKASLVFANPEPIIWSEAKYILLSSIENPKAALPLLTKGKYEASVYKHSSSSHSLDEVLWGLLASLSTEDQSMLMRKNYEHCIVSACQTSHSKQGDHIAIAIVFLELKQTAGN